VKDAAGAIWIGNGDTLSVLTSQNGKLIVTRKISTPMGINPGAHLMTDGSRVYFASWDGVVYSVDPALADAKPVKFCTISGQWRSITMAPASLTKGFAAKNRLFVYSGTTVRGITADGADSGAVLTLPPPAQGAAYYSTIGIEPSTGDLLVGGYYPDVRIYRFSSDGSQVKDGGWPRDGFAEAIVDMDGAPWELMMGGGAQSLHTPLDPTTLETIDRDWTFYGGGIVKDKAGSYWFATSQGLCHFNEHGKAMHQRIGGLGAVALVAIDSDGVALALAESGGRVVRMSLDDDPDASFTSNGNEPWRIGANWTSHAAGIAADGSTFLVLDDKAKQVWRFDPAQNDKQQNAWTKVGTPSNLTAPHAIAVGDSVAWLLDGANLLEGSRADLSNARPVNVPGAGGISFLSSAGDSTLVVADTETVSAFTRKPDGSYVSLWKSTAPLNKIAGIAATAYGVAVSDNNGVTLLSSSSGAVAAKLDCASLPGGATMGAIASQGSWLLVVDSKNARLVRIKISH